MMKATLEIGTQRPQCDKRIVQRQRKKQKIEERKRGAGVETTPHGRIGVAHKREGSATGTSTAGGTACTS